MGKKILVYGATDFGRVVRELVHDCSRQFAGFVDDWNVGPDIVGTLEHVLKTHHPDDYEFVMAIGYNHLQARHLKFSELQARGFAFPSLVHPQAYVSPTAQVHAGALLMARSIADVRVVIGELCVLWPGAAVNHDSTVVANTFISPNAAICGHAHIGRHTFVGAGAVVVDHARVPDSSFIKAGSLFVKDKGQQ